MIHCHLWQVTNLTFNYFQRRVETSSNFQFSPMSVRFLSSTLRPRSTSRAKAGQFPSWNGWPVEKTILVGGFKHFLFSPIVGMMIRSDIHIFQRGRYTTNQLFHFRENSVGNDALSSSGALFKGPAGECPWNQVAVMQKLVLRMYMLGTPWVEVGEGKSKGK